MKNNNILNPSSEIYSRRLKYIFFLIIFFILIVILAIFNPFKIFSNYLYVTLPIILFFLAFIISMLFLYSRNPLELTPVSENSTNWFLKFVFTIIQFGTFVGFIYWSIAVMGFNTFEDVKKNENGNQVSAYFNISMIILLFIISNLTFGSTQIYAKIALVILLLLFAVVYICLKLFSFTTKNIIQYLIISFYCAICLAFLFFGSNPKFFSIKTANENVINNYFFKALMFIFGCGASAAFIYWIVITIGKLDSRSSITSFVLNILIVATILGLAYKTFISGSIIKSSPLLRLIISLIFYIPCIIVNIFEYLAMPFGGFKMPYLSLKEEYANTNKGSLFILMFAILLLVMYFVIPYVKNRNVLQGGSQFINEPVFSNYQRNLASYNKLNGSDDFNYQYAISFWFYIDSDAPNSNANYLKYTSLLNYGNKPNIKYKASDNTLMIVEDLSGGPPASCPDFKINTDGVDENGMRIIYKKTDVLLQKWNNIIINYVGGTLDVFYNGELVKSSVGIIPYMKLDALTIGENNGVHGGICNVIYFNKAINANQIYYIYNSVKNKTPPSLYESNLDVLKDQFNLAGEGDKIVNSKIEIETEKTTSSIQNQFKPIQTSIESELQKLQSNAQSNLKAFENKFTQPNNNLQFSYSIPSISTNISTPSNSSNSSNSSILKNYESQIPNDYKSKIPQEYKSQVPSEYKSFLTNKEQTKTIADKQTKMPTNQTQIPNDNQSQIPKEYQSKIPSNYNNYFF